ncbi:Ca-activated chloride channel family protein [Antricoccus suffuscus]|uniref:Ca-activated chloride channel family protein n=1 Tax=Antricoccus suffuscus TaxID=1629062 RepID=A0A2T1A570_9ACTN|nr:VWA domain-containing protein [Antricoccus suffuscus]PRZ43755.1 Ca-activated chloride channel family protein [Antricoccus suffuscus]
MKFLSPIWLLLLLCVLALIGIYLLLQLRRKNYAARFTNVDMLAKVAPKRPGWRRHIAFALLVVGLGFTSMAMAVPASEVQVPRNRATICMALDVSLSMKATDVKPSRFESMKKSAKNFVDKLPAGINLGLVAFAGSANVLQPPTIDRNAVKNSIDNLKLDQATATGEAIFSCLGAIQNFEKSTKSSDGKPAPARIVLLSDGLRTVGRDNSTAIAAAKKAKIPVSTIAFGTEGATIKQDGETIPVPVDKPSLKQIADETGGTFFSAESASSLEKVYNNIGKQIGYTKEFQPITTRFVGIGLIFAFASAAAALFWTNRLL